MMVALAVAGGVAGVAHAADKPVIGPAAAWVRPATLPTASLKTGEAGTRILLSDAQILFEPGRVSTYSAVAFRIQTPQGLSEVGNLSFPWRPETDVLTVHKLVIRRGDQVIDVLASGQTFTVLRREQNLEEATLDGVLTANIQPEGLQVGDILEFAVTVSSSDPVLVGHVEQAGGSWNDMPIDRAHLRAQWPSTLPVRFRATTALPAIKPIKAGSSTSIELSLDNVRPIIPPKGAPPRYRIRRQIELTDYRDWAELSAFMAPLYAKAAVLPAQGALHMELERIRALSADPKIRVEAALALVQDRIRYVALAMGAGGLVPADAETTWSRRYGDCKGKTALLLALLHALNIQADPVLVSSVYGDGLDTRLPMIGLFNHVIVRATVAARTYWLDGTRTGDTSIDRLKVPYFGWGLPVAASGGALVRMVPEPLETPNEDITIRIDATEGLTTPAPVKIETITRGSDAIGLSKMLANFPAETRERVLRDYWKKEYDFITVRSTKSTFDPKTGELRMTMDGDAKMDWDGASYQTDGTDIGYHADFSRDPGPDQEAPFSVAFPYSKHMQEVILLPKGQGAFKPDAATDIDRTVAGIEYHRHATIRDNIYTIEKSERSLEPEFPAKDAPAAQTILRTLSDHRATLHEPANYKATDKDVSAARADTPVTASDFEKRAGLFAGRGMQKDALQDFDKAIGLDPTEVWAWSNRAIVRIQTGDLAGAKADIAKAETLDPTFPQMFIGRGMLADAEHRPRDAIEAYGQALMREPGNGFALARRAAAYAALGDNEHALADGVDAATQAIAVNPDAAEPSIARGILLLESGRYADALKDFDRAFALEPKNARSLAGRGMIHVVQGEFDAAARDLDAAYAIDPKTAQIFLARGEMAEKQNAWRDAIAAYTAALQITPGDGLALGHRAIASYKVGDNDAALVDAAAAIRVKPTWVDLYLVRANVLRTQNRQEEAIAEAVRVTTANPKNAYAYVAAARIYSAFHKDGEAMQAYDHAIAIKPEAYIYLSRSVSRPGADVAGRQADIDQALKLDATFAPGLAAKGELQMEGGDAAAAIATYTEGLRLASGNAELLLGRGVAYARAGDDRRAQADFSAAGRAGHDTAGWWNTMCWTKAKAGVALESALADCNTALQTNPEAAEILDSRAFVLLRLGRFDDAIKDYDHALARNSRIAASLFGRAVAWAGKGDRTKSDADLAAALKVFPGVRSQFERYGVKL